MDERSAIAPTLVDLLGSVQEESLEHSGPSSEEEIVAAEKELGVPFPRSYREFLRGFGAGFLYSYDIFGLPRESIWGDVVMMNQLAVPPHPRHLVRFTVEIGGFSFYFDTSRMNGEGECPVVVWGHGEDGGVVAENFLDFLSQARDGLI